MLTIIAGIIVIISPVVMGFISYKYPFKTEKGNASRQSKIFTILAIISVICGIYLLWDSNNDAVNNRNAQKELKDSLQNLQQTANKLLKGIDLLGYKQDKVTGDLVRKNPAKVDNSIFVKRGKPLIQQNRKGDNNAAGNDNKGVQGGKNNNNHIVSGNNNQVDINGDVKGDVYTGIKQRHASDSLINSITSKLPNKEITIQFTNGGGDEGFNYIDEIGKKLLALGYTKILRQIPEVLASAGFQNVAVLKTNDSSYQIMISPASNVR